MRIVVATRAIQILPVIDGRWLGLKLCRLLVAVGARGREVAAGQRKVRFLMSRQSKRRRLIGLESVAPVAGIEIGSGRKLSGVAIAVAISAAREFDFE